MRLLKIEKNENQRKIILFGIIKITIKRKNKTKIPFGEKLLEEFGYKKSHNLEACVDKAGNPLPWYTYPAIEYLSQFDYSDKLIF